MGIIQKWCAHLQIWYEACDDVPKVLEYAQRWCKPDLRGPKMFESSWSGSRAREVIRRCLDMFAGLCRVFPLHHPCTASQCITPYHCSVRGRGQKPIHPNIRVFMHFGAVGWALWKSLMRSGASRSSSEIHEFSLHLYPFHHTRYCKLLPLILQSIISSTSYLSSPSTILGGGGHCVLRPSIGLGGAGISLTTLKTGCSRDMNWGSFRWYACKPTGRTTGNSPR
jgi:hypothetical protein